MISIRLVLSAEDLAHTRFAFSALWETVASYRAQRRPEKFPLHLPWIKEARAALVGVDLSPIENLIFPGSYPDFLTPPPSTPLPDFASELEHLLQTPPEVVAQDFRNILDNRSGIYRAVPEFALEGYLHDPRGSLERLAETLWLYWERAMAPHWPRLRTLLEADVMYRARMFALSGPEKVFNGLHPSVRYQDRTLHILPEGPESGVSLELSGRGLLLIPSVFMDHTVMLDPPWQETLQYGARGTAGLWSPEPPPAKEALEKLLGQNRARLLKAILTPSTTQELAYLFQVTPSAISQHLSWLREVGLVATQRNGKNVYYQLSPIGEQLLEAYGELETPLALAV